MFGLKQAPPEPKKKTPVPGIKKVLFKKKKTLKERLKNLQLKRCKNKEVFTTNEHGISILHHRNPDSNDKFYKIYETDRPFATSLGGNGTLSLNSNGLVFEFNNFHCPQKRCNLINDQRTVLLISDKISIIREEENAFLLMAMFHCIYCGVAFTKSVQFDNAVGILYKKRELQLYFSKSFKNCEPEDMVAYYPDEEYILPSGHQAIIDENIEVYRKPQDPDSFYYPPTPSPEEFFFNNPEDDMNKFLFSF